MEKKIQNCSTAEQPALTVKDVKLALSTPEPLRVTLKPPPPQKAVPRSEPKPSACSSKLSAMHLFTRIFLELRGHFFFLNTFFIDDYHPILGLHN